MYVLQDGGCITRDVDAMGLGIGDGCIAEGMDGCRGVLFSEPEP